MLRLWIPWGAITGVQFITRYGLLNRAGELNSRIPNLGTTENVPSEAKVIHQRYLLRRCGFYWLIAELDRREGLAFGYSNMNQDDLAEWGYISIRELIQNGAQLDTSWKPCSFSEARLRIQAEELRTS